MSTKDDVLAAVKHGEDQYERGLRAALAAVRRERDFCRDRLNEPAVVSAANSIGRAIERLLEETRGDDNGK